MQSMLRHESLRRKLNVRELETVMKDESLFVVFVGALL